MMVVAERDIDVEFVTRSRGVLVRTIFGGQATSPAESGHVSGIAKSGSLPLLLCCYGRDMWQSSVAYYNRMPLMPLFLFCGVSFIVFMSLTFVVLFCLFVPRSFPCVSQ